MASSVPSSRASVRGGRQETARPGSGHRDPAADVRGGRGRPDRDRPRARLHAWGLGPRGAAGGAIARAGGRPRRPPTACIRRTGPLPTRFPWFSYRTPTRPPARSVLASTPSPSDLPTGPARRASPAGGGRRRRIPGGLVPLENRTGLRPAPERNRPCFLGRVDTRKVGGKIPIVLVLFRLQGRGFPA